MITLHVQSQFDGEPASEWRVNPIHIVSMWPDGEGANVELSTGTGRTVVETIDDVHQLWLAAMTPVDEWGDPTGDESE